MYCLIIRILVNTPNCNSVLACMLVHEQSSLIQIRLMAAHDVFCMLVVSLQRFCKYARHERHCEMS